MTFYRKVFISIKSKMVVACEFVCGRGGGGGGQGGFMYASYKEKGRKEGEGVQNPELSCVSTSLKTPHANICKYES